MSKKQPMCANSKPRSTATGQQLYTRNACTLPALRGHIFCERCRREDGGYFVRHPKVLTEKEAKERGMLA